MRKNEEPDYAKGGQKAKYTVFLPKGIEALQEYSHSMETQFRALGLPTKLTKQKIELLADTYVCKEGEELGVEQCKLLKLLDHKMSKFSLHVLCGRTDKGKFTETEAGR